MASLEGSETRSKRSIIPRVWIVGLAAFGIYRGGFLSLHHHNTGDACPTLGPLPICYLVLLGYVLVLMSALLGRRLFKPFFYIGWLPVFAMALMGAIVHTFVGEICPVDGNGLPQCYVSLGLAVTLYFSFATALKHDR